MISASAGQAVAAAGPYPLLDTAVGFVTERILADGPQLKPAYTVSGGPVPDERPAATCPATRAARTRSVTGSTSSSSSTPSARRCCCWPRRPDTTGWIATAGGPWRPPSRRSGNGSRDPDAGIWELDEQRWAHSRLTCVAGLRAAAAVAPAAQGAAWSGFADALLAEVTADCLHPSGRWQRAPGDDRVDAALLLPALRGAMPPADPARPGHPGGGAGRTVPATGTCTASARTTGRSGQAEGAFLLCGFTMALALHQQGREVEAARWFERNRAACGPPGLLTEEYDITQRQVRGNAPQAFVHALLLESAQRLACPAHRRPTSTEQRRSHMSSRACRTGGRGDRGQRRHRAGHGPGLRRPRREGGAAGPGRGRPGRRGPRRRAGGRRGPGDTDRRRRPGSGRGGGGRRPKQALGPIDVWVNVAFTSVFAPFTEITPAEYKRVTEVSYLGYVYGTMAALKRMLPRDAGTIVQVGSALAYRGIPLQSAYCGAKHAIQGFNESLRCELLHDKSNVRVTMVQMPAVNTPQFDWVLSRLPKPAQPVPPIYQPEVAARGVLYAADHPGPAGVLGRRHHGGHPRGQRGRPRPARPVPGPHRVLRPAGRPARVARRTPSTCGSPPTGRRSRLHRARQLRRPVQAAQRPAVGLPAPRPAGRRPLLGLAGAAAAVAAAGRGRRRGRR